MDGQGTKCRRNIAENYNRLSRVHERYRQTDDRQTNGRQHIANMNAEMGRTTGESAMMLCGCEVKADMAHSTG